MKSGELRISGGLMKVAQAMAASSVFSLVHIKPWITTGLCLMLPVCIFFANLTILFLIFIFSKVLNTCRHLIARNSDD